jgi:hypothetical protein
VAAIKSCLITDFGFAFKQDLPLKTGFLPVFACFLVLRLNKNLGQISAIGSVSVLS